MREEPASHSQSEQVKKHAYLMIARDTWFVPLPVNGPLLDQLLSGPGRTASKTDCGQKSVRTADEPSDVASHSREDSTAADKARACFLQFLLGSSHESDKTDAGKLRIEPFALTDGQVGFLNRWSHETRSDQLTVELPPELISLGLEWDRAIGRIEQLPDTKRSDVDTARGQFSQRLLAELQCASWIPTPWTATDLQPIIERWKSNPAGFAGWIEKQLNEQGVTLAVDGQYHGSLVRFGKGGELGLLVTYSSREESSNAEKLIESCRLLVPDAFHAPLSDRTKPPTISSSGTVLPTSYSDVVAVDDLGEQDETFQEADKRTREAFEQHGSEAFGWYQTCHAWNADCWGIVLNVSKINDLGRALKGRLADAGLWTGEEALQVASNLILEHEFFHARVDFLSLGQELVSRTGLALQYNKHVYKKSVGTSDAIEEALANYVALEAVRNLVHGWRAGHHWSQEKVDVALDFIEELFDVSPPGYSDWQLGEDPDVWRRLVWQVLEGRVDVYRDLPPLEDWLLRPETALITIRDVPVYYWISDESLADRLFSVPSRREAERFLRSRGYRSNPARGKGSHILWESSDGRVFPLPHNNPLSKKVFHGLLEHFGMTKKYFLDLRKNL